MDQTNSESYLNKGVGYQTLETLEEAVNYNNWVCSKIRPHLGDLNIEIGAGHGTMSAILAKTHSLVLTEASSACLEQLNNRFTEHPNVKDIQKNFLDYDQLIDSVYSSNVLEHLEDDLMFIKKSCEILRPGGKFIAFVPAGKWLYSDYDKSIGHFRRYTNEDKKRIQLFIEQNQLPLEFEQYRSYNPIGALGWFVKMVLLKTKTVQKEDALLFDKLLPFISWLDVFSPILFGQSILMVLRRK